MPKVTFTIDTLKKDKTIYKKGDETYSLNTKEFLKYLTETFRKEERERWVKLPDNCIAFRKNEYKIILKSYKDYITHERKKYFVKWPELVLTVVVNQNKIWNLKAKFKHKKRTINFKAPNFSDGQLCFGSYNPKISKLDDLTNEIKKIFQVPFTNDYYRGDVKKFFKTWEEKGYIAAFELEEKKYG